FAATSNPFVGLIVGLLATTVMQSSSVTTSMVVALVAAPENPLPLANAIPMVMGANIGTTVTATIVSLAHIGRRDEFERAFPVAICHDIFNYLAVLVLLPVEIATGYLGRTASTLAETLGHVGGVEYESPLNTALSAGFAPVIAMAQGIFAAEGGQAVFLIGVSGAFIFFALFLLVKVMRAAVTSRVEGIIDRALSSSATIAMLVGVVVTVMVQSSSITTSLLVPLGGAGLLRLEQAFPVTIGANIGTTVTALLAALAVSGPNAAAGLEIALVHLLFNMSGLLLIYPVKAIRRLPLEAARRVTKLALRSRKLTVVWVALLFYGLPALCIAIGRLFE
ncbi:MAG: Na/Pi symporter, partial [Acidobacteriota bacterium]|nr:Na/Pi symporter [Acidobacteriota bacterium]